MSNTNSDSPILAHYATGYEAHRLATGAGQLERARTQEIIRRTLPASPAKILDVGGGPGIYATWLATLDYAVQLIDVTPLHVEQARESFESRQLTNARAAIGDARALSYGSQHFDAALLLGPLYHLSEQEDRLIALREAHRVLKAKGVLIAAGISRYASLLDGFFRGYISDDAFDHIVERDLETGKHVNHTDNPFYFTDAFFHRPEELRREVELAGFRAVQIIAVEGPFWCLQNFDEVWSQPAMRRRMLEYLRKIEDEPSLIGASAHLLAIAHKDS